MGIGPVDISACNGIEQLVIREIGNCLRPQVRDFSNRRRISTPAINCMARGTMLDVGDRRVKGKYHSAAPEQYDYEEGS